jgi:hypothetical protein
MDMIIGVITVIGVVVFLVVATLAISAVIKA